MNKIKISIITLLCVVSFLTCETDPLTGKTTMAFLSNSELFASSFSQYRDFLNDPENGSEVTGTADAEMVARLGKKISDAAILWYDSIGESSYLNGYAWEVHLIQNKQVNAWCMPGGKIVVYTGILPYTQNEDALAVVMGHEVAHALLNHGKQRVSAGLLQQLGLVGVSITGSLLGVGDNGMALLSSLYGLGTNLGVMLPFSRDNESEADHYGLILMAIAGYNPDAAEPFWARMASASGGSGTKLEEFLSTHPSSASRASALRALAPEARKRAAKLHIDTLKNISIPAVKEIATEINGQ